MNLIVTHVVPLCGCVVHMCATCFNMFVSEPVSLGIIGDHLPYILLDSSYPLESALRPKFGEQLADVE